MNLAFVYIYVCVIIIECKNVDFKSIILGGSGEGFTQPEFHSVYEETVGFSFSFLPLAKGEVLISVLSGKKDYLSVFKYCY